ncbi:MAG: hypothetical protein CME40_03180 [Haliea sp.]|nr:hypothetical protein [Haliea sp.]|tara:strand:+ start:159646 stop:159882 length:237 start_codon:yes stop_codon:yes gene_type:complete
MSLYHPNRDITALLSAAKQWAKRCLIDDGSLLGQHQLWTLESLTELDRALVQNPLVGDTSYIENSECSWLMSPPRRLN